MPVPQRAIPDWARVHGDALFSATLRASPEDFLVTEELGFEPSGDGEHDFLFVEKTGTNTAWLARQLSRFANVAVRDVGYAGLKDRNAVTSQWFSVRRPSAEGTDWDRCEIDGVRILERARNAKKLRRGAHAANRFRIALRGDGVDKHSSVLEERLAAIRSIGIPNYFGEQRFGHAGRNIDLARAVFAGKRVKREQRSIAISAARSLLFNAILDRRVREGSWDTMRAGDLANLDGTASIFSVEHVTRDIVARCAAFDIHPSGGLWGKDAPLAGYDIAALEADVAREYSDLADGLVAAGVDAGSRSLRVLPSSLEASSRADVIWLSFALPRGSYATAVLREIAVTD